MSVEINNNIHPETRFSVFSTSFSITTVSQKMSQELETFP